VSFHLLKILFSLYHDCVCDILALQPKLAILFSIFATEVTLLQCTVSLTRTHPFPCTVLWPKSSSVVHYICYWVLSFCALFLVAWSPYQCTVFVVEFCCWVLHFFIRMSWSTADISYLSKSCLRCFMTYEITSYWLFKASITNFIIVMTKFPWLFESKGLISRWPWYYLSFHVTISRFTILLPVFYSAWNLNLNYLDLDIISYFFLILQLKFIEYYNSSFSLFPNFPLLPKIPSSPLTGWSQ